MFSRYDILSRAALRYGAAFLTTMVAGLLADGAWAQTAAPVGSSVNAYFGSESDAYHQSDPSGFAWTSVGTGSYAPGSPLYDVPPPPTASFSVPSGNPFSGVGHLSAFNDGYPPGTQTTAQSVINDHFNPSPTLTSDESVAMPSWTLTQLPNTLGYAYEQLNFASNYLVTNNALGLGASTNPNLPFYVSGFVHAPLPNDSSTYAQFDSTVNYSWIPVTIDPNTHLVTPSGPPVSLGDLTYTYLQTNSGPFSSTVPSIGSLAATPPGDGVLALDGYMWLAGDPSQITAVTPEPSTLALSAVAAVLLGGGAWRRRKARD